MKPLVIARPEPGNSETANAARAQGLQVVASPLFEVKSTKYYLDISNNYDALFITSANAIRMASRDLAPFLGLPLFAVGPHSAAAARGAGFSNIITGKTDGQGLAERAAAAGMRRLLHLVGAPYKPVSHPALQMDVCPVYETLALPPSPELLAALARPCVLLVHSPRIARQLADLAEPKAKAETDLVAISAQTGAAAGRGWKSVQWPDQPDNEAMLALAGPLCRAPATGRTVV